MKFSAKKPHFFKVILDSVIRDGKLCIPSEFVRKYGSDLSSSVFLKVPSGANWKVELMKRDGEIWLHNGWQEFQKYYFLSHGSILVFERSQQGNSDFNVIIFDKSASEVDYPFDDINNRDKEGNLEKEFQGQRIGETSSDVSVEILSHCPPSLTTKQKPPIPISQPNKKIKLVKSTGQLQAKRENGGMSSENKKLDEAMIRKQPLTAKEKANALDRASSNFRSRNPFFMVPMQPSYVNPAYHLVISASFVKKHFNKKSGNVILRTMDGKTWRVGYIYNVNNGQVTAQLGRGWKVFSQENNLEIGDVCVFELINRTNTTLKVSISRCIKDANNNSSLGKANPKQLKQEEGSSNCSQFFKSGSSSKAPEAVEAADKFASLNPFYKANMRSCRKIAYVPSEFFKKCTRKKKENVMLQVGNRKWPVKLIGRPAYRGSFCAGWPLFAKENSLQDGDVCIFELINPENLLINVSIFRKD